jgi:hypothetical protein
LLPTIIHMFLSTKSPKSVAPVVTSTDEVGTDRRR